MSEGMTYRRIPWRPFAILAEVSPESLPDLSRPATPKTFDFVRALAMRIAILVALFGLVTSLRRSSSKSQSNFIFRRRRSRAVYGNTWKQHFEGYMSALKQTSNPDGFDSKCEPYIQEPRGESKGLVVLQHGSHRVQASGTCRPRPWSNKAGL